MIWNKIVEYKLIRDCHIDDNNDNIIIKGLVKKQKYQQNSTLKNESEDHLKSDRYSLDIKSLSKGVNIHQTNNVSEVLVNDSLYYKQNNKWFNYGKVNNSRRAAIK